jgi:uncharacterized protein YyaL (SSP411 family)
MRARREGLARGAAPRDDGTMRTVRRWRACARGLLALASLVAARASPAQDPSVQPPPAQPPSNRLAKEASPYLRQHQHNPVDWYPWGPEALARAKKEDKPIFLSIGYSACHWCHVMAAESFSDPAIAALLNANFVCIKVDREERPDIDEIYMAGVQAMGESGGWPLSAWLTPDGRPFFGGTYFPPEDAMGRPGFRRVLEQLVKAWRDRRGDVLASADELTKHLQQALAPELRPGEPDAALLANVLPASRARFDAKYGGFAVPPHFAPKFPSAIELQVLLRLPGDAALELVVPTLRAMHRGGIYDQLGGGFHRYATDRAWSVPHFEKMLYDNALLVPCYLDAFVRTGDDEFATAARETLDYMLRELQAPEGGFWSSQDAQSEGVEGKFFVWQQREVEQVLGDSAPAACAHFGVTVDGNWEHTNVLSLPNGPATGDSVQPLAAARARLFAARAKRVHPGTDDKVLAAWNGMALRALAAGFRVLGDERYRAAARKAADFLVRELVRDGAVQRAWHGGNARHAGCLEDYAALADGLECVFEIDGDPRWLATVRTLLAALRDRFGADDGGFWFTAAGEQELVARTKVAYEGSTPSGMALAVSALLRGGLLLGDEALYARGVAALRANHALLAANPAGASALVLALQFHLADPREVVVAGEPDDPRTQALLRAAWRAFPGAQVVANVHAKNRDALAVLSPLFADKQPLAGVPAAYVCRRGVCKLPVTDAKSLAEGR